MRKQYNVLKNKIRNEETILQEFSSSEAAFIALYTLLDNTQSVLSHPAWTEEDRQKMNELLKEIG